jgi:hypothetical protein
MKNLHNILKKASLLFVSICLFTTVFAQTDIDAIMMSKNNFCTGPVYTHSSWKNYWEGSLKRKNLNLGTVSAQMFSLMGNYGISDKLNVLFGLPYVKTKATAGSLKGMSGMQDVSLWIKYMPVEKEFGPGTFSVYTIGGFSTPVSNYLTDYLPLSIGRGSTNFSFRGMLDYQLKDWFATISGTYVRRNNITIDRPAYYTTELHLTNQVEMPDATNLNVRAGYRTTYFLAETVLNKWKTLGGFDISRNNMPFPGNRINETTAGINLKYTLKAVEGLSVTGGANYTLTGRNVGQSATYNGGIFYIFDFTHTAKTTTSKQN